MIGNAQKAQQIVNCRIEFMYQKTTTKVYLSLQILIGISRNVAESNRGNSWAKDFAEESNGIKSVSERSKKRGEEEGPRKDLWEYHRNQIIRISSVQSKKCDLLHGFHVCCFIWTFSATHCKPLESIIVAPIAGILLKFNKYTMSRDNKIYSGNTLDVCAFIRCAGAPNPFQFTYLLSF